MVATLDEDSRRNFYFHNCLIQLIKVPGVGRDNLNVEYTTVERGCKYEKDVNGVKTIFPSGFSLLQFNLDSSLSLF